MQLKDNKLTPKKGYHLQDKNGNVFEGCIYLGCYDSKSNYVEITEEEYQAILIEIQKKLEEEQDV